MFKSGKFVAEHLRPHDGGELDDKQIQPNGVDLTIDKILEYRGSAFMGDGEYSKPTRSEAPTVPVSELGGSSDVIFDSDEVYQLPPGGYVVVYDEEIIEIPDAHVGFVWPRSRFLRCSSHLTSAVWDTGYSGRGEGGLITTQPMFVEPEMRIGQMTFARADNFESYDGTHQGERK
jgi:dUTP pyrophosphatase